jgi:hypothetical protein
MGGADGTRRVASVGFGLLKHFFQISMPIRKMARAIPIMAAGEVKVQCVLAGWIWSSSLNSNKLPIVLCPEALDGSLDALVVGPSEEFHQFSGPVHGLLPDLDHFRFIRRDHLVHGPNVASCDCVS